MRGELNAIGNLFQVETNLDEKTCQFQIEKSVDVKKLLDKLAKDNHELQDWSIVEK